MSNNELNKLLTNELDKIYNVYLFYKKVLETCDYDNNNTVDHIRNIRHYTELLEERIDEFNHYNIIKKLPVCQEQLDRDANFEQNKKYLYNFFNQNL